MSADAAAAADAAAERRLNHSIPRTYFVRGIQLLDYCNTCGVSNVQRGSVSTLTDTSNSHSERDFTVEPEQLNQNQVLNTV